MSRVQKLSCPSPVFENSLVFWHLNYIWLNHFSNDGLDREFLFPCACFTVFGIFEKSINIFYFTTKIMSYQAQQTVNQFIPNYVVKSDYLPTRINDGDQSQTNQWVQTLYILDQAIWRRKKKRKSFHPETCWVQSISLRFLQSLRNRQSRPAHEWITFQSCCQEMIFSDPLNLQKILLPSIKAFIII